MKVKIHGASYLYTSLYHPDLLESSHRHTERAPHASLRDSGTGGVPPGWRPQDPPMTTDDKTAEKPTDDDTESLPIIEVDVARETAHEAARLADEHGIAIEDALARLTAFDYPEDVLHTSRGERA